jgi:hypothetical protein
MVIMLLALLPLLTAEQATLAIVLTGTINTNSVEQIARTDPAMRQEDYLTSLTKWLTLTSHSLVFCENSAAPLDWLDDVQLKFPGRLEVLSFEGNSFEGNKGKGYGEALTIDYVLKSSATVKRVEYLVKVSGRYFVTNLDSILETTVRGNGPGKIAYIESFSGKGWTPSEVVIFRPAFFEDYFHWDDINDSAQRMFEESLAAAATIAQTSGHSIGYFACAELDGVSGSTNSPRSRKCKHNDENEVSEASEVLDQTLELNGVCEYMDMNGLTSKVGCAAAHYAISQGMMPLTTTGALHVLDVMGCEPLPALAKDAPPAIALVDRGECQFGQKVRHAQNAGYVGVAIGDNGNGTLIPPGLGNDDSLSIPCVMVSLGTTTALKHRTSSVEVDGATGLQHLQFTIAFVR